MERAKVNDLQLLLGGSMYDLHRLAAHRVERRAQHFVPLHHQRKSALQRGYVEWPAEPQVQWNVVGSTPRLDLVEEPESLLRERRGKDVRLLRAREFRRFAYVRHVPFW